MASQFNLDGKVAMVTGASGGLGAGFVTALIENGARVAGTARSTEKLAPIASKYPDAFVPVALDVTDVDAVAATISGLADRLGSIDIVVNNAGVSSYGPALDADEADWDFVMDTNLKGCWAVAQQAALHMKDEGGGSIINVASILGARVAGQVASYAASKAALIQLTKALALEWARYGIRVNALAPGYIETDLNRAFFASEAGRKLIARIPQRRLGKVEELNGPLLLLASDAGSLMTGAVLACDGGHLVSSL